MSKYSEITEVKTENEMERLQQHCDGLKAKLEQSKRDFETLRKDFVKATEGENAKMSFKIYEEKRKAKEMADLQEKFKILEDDYKVLTNEKHTLAGSLEKAKSAADVLLDLKLAAECEVAVSETKIKELENTSFALENKQRGLKRKLAQAMEGVAEKEKEVEMAFQQYNNMSSEVVALKEKVHESTEREAYLEFENKRLKDEVKAYKNCVKHLFQEHCNAAAYFQKFPALWSSTREDDLDEQSACVSPVVTTKEEFLNRDNFGEADSFFDEFGRRQ